MLHSTKTADIATLTDVVNRCFALFKANWPRKFASIWQTVEEVRASKVCWLRALKKADITQAMFEAGLERVSEKVWPPDNPAEFIQCCHVTPSMVGAPTLKMAFKIAKRECNRYSNNHWEHKAVYHAATYVGLGRMMTYRGDESRLLNEFEVAYSWACDHLAQIDDPPTACIEKKREMPTDAEAEAFLAQLRSTIRH